jgi:arginine-tRNA-protein transferase
MATDEQFALLQQYLTARHNGGGMSDMDFHRYQMMVEECASETDVIEFRDTDNNLLGVTLIDKLTDGYSMVYSFYDTNLKARSLGTFMILSQINRCKNDSLPYLYLGYWVKGSTKMQYKSRFQPYELLSRNGWHEGGNA